MCIAKVLRGQTVGPFVVQHQPDFEQVSRQRKETCIKKIVLSIVFKICLYVTRCPLQVLGCAAGRLVAYERCEGLDALSYLLGRHAAAQQVFKQLDHCENFDVAFHAGEFSAREKRESAFVADLLLHQIIKMVARRYVI